jgi:hypothetical protein
MGCLKLSNDEPLKFATDFCFLSRLAAPPIRLTNDAEKAPTLSRAWRSARVEAGLPSDC